ncbi:lipopolysaccharide biosynthesis protein [Eudoraea adriatica]|uniref:lipopolysaccharide biosynthesis protein n=1 Tax=Eudoraea adriatica TaxID=446681 RepID=UPI00036EB980|nr:hypothetical protein [Eudoraea adriatica]
MKNIIKLIRSGKYLELSKLFSILLDQFFMSISTLLTTIVLARTYDKVVYAEFVLLISVTLFILGLQNSIISKPYAINLIDFKDEQQSRYFHFNAYAKLIFSLLIILIFPFVYFLIFGDFSVSRLLPYLTYIVAYTFYFYVREMFLSERKTIQNLIYGLFCSLSLIALLVYILYSKNVNINFFLIIASSIYFIVTIVFFINNFRSTKLIREEVIQYISANWKVGKWLLGTSILFQMSSGIFPWLLLYLTTKNDIAIFGVLTSISSIINPILQALSSYLLPLFVKFNLNYEKIKALVNKWTLVFGFMALSLIILGYFFGQNLIILFFGDKYSKLGYVVVMPFIAQAINIFFQPFNISLKAIKRTDVEFWLYIPTTVLTIIIGYFSVLQYGLVGVFYTIFFQNLFYNILQYLVYFRLFRTKEVL